MIPDSYGVRVMVREDVMRIRRYLWFVNIVLGLLSARSASAATFVCSTGDWFCLHNAVASANALPGADTIVLNGGTYSLLTSLSCSSIQNRGCDALGPITGSLTIIGNGRDTTIIQPDPRVPPMRVFDVAPGAFLTLQNLTVRGVHSTGSAGDPSYGGLGILNAGMLTLTNVAIRDNELDNSSEAGAGIRNDPSGTIYMSNSLVSNNTDGGGTSGGAGIRNDGNLSVASSAITGNSGLLGGGISNRGTAIVSRTTVSGNFAVAGGGIYSIGSLTVDESAITTNTTGGNGGPSAEPEEAGAGVFVDAGGTSTIRNSTIAQNWAYNIFAWGGGFRVVGSLVLTGSTVADNRSYVGPPGSASGIGGGIRIDGTASIRNSIIARNAADDGSGYGIGPDCFGTLTSLGHNIVGTTSGCTFTPQAGDSIGDPRLGAFTDQIRAADGSPQGNGHIPLLSQSIAIDAGDTTVCTATDQLGYPRVDANINNTTRTCDIGASEYAPSVYPWVTLLSSQTVRDTTPLPGYPGGTITITRQYQMNTDRVLYPVFVLQRITDGALLTNCDPPSPCANTARLTPNVGADSVWSVGEAITVTYVFGITKKITSVNFATDVVGYPHLP